MDITAREIARTQDIIAYHQSGWRKEIVVTFNGMVNETSVTGSFAGKVPLGKLGYPVLSFQAVKSNWYPASQMEQLIPAALAELQPYGERIGYGFSMGAYGSIRYSKALGLTKTLALSPQWAIDPQILPWERRYLAHVGSSEKAMIAAEHCGGEIYLLYDPDEHNDKLQADHILPLPGVIGIKASGFQHDTIDIVTGTQALGQALAQVIAGDVLGLKRQILSVKRARANRRCSLLYTRAAKLLQRGDYGGANRLAALVLQEPTRLSYYGWLQARALMKLGRHGEAEAVVRSELAHFPQAYVLYEYLAEALEHQGQYKEALAACLFAIDKISDRQNMETIMARLAQKAGYCDVTHMRGDLGLDSRSF